jgi:hypothetical protein
VAWVGCASRVFRVTIVAAWAEFSDFRAATVSLRLVMRTFIALFFILVILFVPALRAL